MNIPPLSREVSEQMDRDDCPRRVSQYSTPGVKDQLLVCLKALCTGKRGGGTQQASQVASGVRQASDLIVLFRIDSCTSPRSVIWQVSLTCRSSSLCSTGPLSMQAPKPRCLYYQSFIISLKIWHKMSLNFVSQNYLSFLKFVFDSLFFYISLGSYKYSHTSYFFTFLRKLPRSSCLILNKMINNEQTLSC